MRSLITTLFFALTLFCGDADASVRKAKLADCPGGDLWALQCVASPHVHKSALTTRRSRSGNLDIATAGIVVSLACELGVSLIPGLDFGGKVINAFANGFVGGVGGGLCTGLLGNALGLNKPRPPRVVHVNRNIVVDNPLPYETDGSTRYFFNHPTEAVPQEHGPTEVPMAEKIRPATPTSEDKKILIPPVINPKGREYDAKIPGPAKFAAPGLVLTRR